MAARPRTAVRRRKVLGVGLVLILLAVLVQVLSLTVLPWARLEGSGPALTGVPGLWQLAAEHGTRGFGGWYVLLFNYPLALLGILLALASVLESVALKMIWGGLALVGLGVLVLRYGFGPFAEVALTDEGLHLSTQEITTATIALAALVMVIFVLRTAVSTFRRLAGLILLGLSGVHVAAIVDLVRATGAEQLSIGAFGPAVGYLLTAAAAFIGPRRFIGL